MRMPGVTDRMKEAPTQALRTVFAGIGQLVLAAEKMMSRTTAADPAPAAADRPEQARKDRAERTDSARRPGSDAYSARWRSLDQTGNVRILAPEELAKEELPKEELAPQPPASPQPAWELPTMKRPDDETADARPSADGSLPVSNYDELSLPSLRARLRHLDRAQLRVLLDYEQANAGREAILTMFERRIAKLEGGEA
jgi:hypothetical protein